MQFKKILLNKVMQKINNQKIISILFVIIFSIIFYNFIFFIATNIVNIPLSDQWSIANAITNKTNIFQILFYQHNEHKIGTGLLIMKILASYSNWNQILEVKFVSFLILSSLGIISIIKYSFEKKIQITDILLPLIFLNIFQFENITWGFQIAFVLPLFFFCLWISALKITNIKFRYFLLSILSLLSAFSSFHGLILPFVTIILLFLDYFKYKLTGRKIFILVTAANIAIICSYFIGFVRNFQTTTSIVPSWAIIKYFSLAISNGFFYSINNPFLNIAIALIVLYFLILGISKIFKNKHQKNDVLIIGCALILYSLVFVSIISAGRSSFGTGQALSSRYVTFTMLFPVGLFFIFSSIKNGNFLKIFLLVIILSNSLFFNNKIIKSYSKVSEARKKAFECYKTATTSDLDKCYKICALYPNKEYLNQRIVGILQYKKSNKFDKIDEIAATINNVPDGIAEPRKTSELFTDYQNIKIENSDFIALNNDPVILVAVDDNIKGISWESSVTGNVQAFFTTNETASFSEKNSFEIKPINETYIINLEKIREIMAKKIFKLRIDPTDSIEEFEIKNLQIYK